MPDDTFRELDEFQEDPPHFLEENSWEGEESDHSDPTLTLLNKEHFQVRGAPVQSLIYLLQGWTQQTSNKLRTFEKLNMLNTDTYTQVHLLGKSIYYIVSVAFDEIVMCINTVSRTFFSTPGGLPALV